MECITNTEGHLEVYSATNRIFPLIKLFLNGDEIISLSKNERVNFIRNIWVFNPNTKQDYLCDVIFTGENFIDSELLSFSDGTNVIHGKIICSPDNYGKFFEIIMADENNEI